jgi:transposase-like protein
MARRKITAEFKFKVTLEALKERCTLEELGAEMNVAPSQISRWVKGFKMNGKNIFTKDNKLGKKIELLEKEQARLYGIVGELTAKNDWLKKKLERLEEL